MDFLCIYNWLSSRIFYLFTYNHFHLSLVRFLLQSSGPTVPIIYPKTVGFKFGEMFNQESPFSEYLTIKLICYQFKNKYLSLSITDFTPSRLVYEYELWIRKQFSLKDFIHIRSLATGFYSMNFYFCKFKRVDIFKEKFPFWLVVIK